MIQSLISILRFIRFVLPSVPKKKKSTHIVLMKTSSESTHIVAMLCPVIQTLARESPFPENPKTGELPPSKSRKPSEVTETKVETMHRNRHRCRITRHERSRKKLVGKKLCNAAKVATVCEQERKRVKRESGEGREEDRWKRDSSCREDCLSCYRRYVSVNMCPASEHTDCIRRYIGSYLFLRA